VAQKTAESQGSTVDRLSGKNRIMTCARRLVTMMTIAAALLLRGMLCASSFELMDWMNVTGSTLYSSKTSLVVLWPGPVIWPWEPNPDAPVITQPLQSAILIDGEELTLTVAADGKGQELSYLWSVDGSYLKTVSGPSLTVKGRGLNYLNRPSLYSVMVTNKAGTVRSSAYVLDLPKQELKRTLLETPAGGAGSIGLVGAPEPDWGSYTWISVMPNFGAVSFQWSWGGENKASFTESQLRFSPVELSDAGSYRCTVKVTGLTFLSYPPELTLPGSRDFDFQLSVLPQSAPPILERVRLPTAQVGLEYVGSAEIVGSGTAKVRWKGLPPGLRGSATGQVTGIPKQAGSYTVEVTPYNANGIGKSMTQSVVVNPVLGTGSYLAVACPRGAAGVGIVPPEPMALEFHLTALGTVTGKFHQGRSSWPFSTTINAVTAEDVRFSVDLPSSAPVAGTSIIVFPREGSCDVYSNLRTTFPKVQGDTYFTVSGTGLRKTPRAAASLNLLVSPLEDGGYDHARLQCSADGSITGLGRSATGVALSLKAMSGPNGEVAFYAAAGKEGYVGFLNPTASLALEGTVQNATERIRKVRANPSPALPSHMQLVLGGSGSKKVTLFKLGQRGLGLPVGVNAERAWLTFDAATGQFSFGYTDALIQRRTSGTGLLMTNELGQAQGGGRYLLPDGSGAAATAELVEALLP
jgi:hypothetical protein